jgi:glycosyltransferase involved in cell wall biosynthesis
VKVIIVAPGADTGGQGIAIKRAFDKHAPGWTVRSVTKKNNYLAQEPDLMWDRDEDEIRAFYAEADVVHVRLTARALRDLDDWKQPRKPFVYHHHGTLFRDGPRPHIRWAQRCGAQLVVSTLDLWQIAPNDLQWLPAPIDIDRLAAIRAAAGDDRTVPQIVHCPTSRAAKGTDRFLRAAEQLHDEQAFTVDVVEGVTWEECLQRKAHADLFFDQLTYGYGNNALEAWAMGIPVVSGARRPAVLTFMRAILGELPFLDAVDGTLRRQLEWLLADKDLRREYSDRGCRYVDRYHSEAAVVERLRGIWTAASAGTRGDLDEPAVAVGG